VEVSAFVQADWGSMSLDTGLKFNSKSNSKSKPKSNTIEFRQWYE
jgi:hypothetical protein